MTIRLFPHLESWNGWHDKYDFPIQKSLKWYAADNFMGGAGNMDRDKKIRVMLTTHAMFKKWYCMGLTGIFNFMIINGQNEWNMSDSIIDNHYELDNSCF